MKTRNLVLALLVLLSVITFLDRLAIAAAGPRMQQELGLDPKQWGWILGAFVLAYGVFEIPTGAMGDRMGQRRVITRIVVWWSVFTALTGAVSGFVPLLATRFLFGAGEAGAYPNMAASVARWFPRMERARAQGFVWGGSRAGGALAPLLVVPLQARFGWRASFWILGVIGVAWASVWWWWYRDLPAQSGRVSEEELAEIGSSSNAETHEAAPWGRLLRSRQLWLILGMYSSYAWSSWFYFSWLHTYLVRGRGFSYDQMAVISALAFAFGAAANLAGGYVGDLAVRKLGVKRGRRMIGCASLSAGAVLLLATALTRDQVSATVLISLGLGVTDLMLPSAWATCVDIGGRYTGTVTGAMNSAGQLGGFLCTVLFGYIVALSGSYDLPLVVIAAMLTLSAVLFSRIDSSRPLFEEAEATANGGRD
ncbi:MAG: MFS transporter [Acidobacteria bacterium]|nr:MFS transporter [Acidobacteriota bacterium]